MAQASPAQPPPQQHYTNGNYQGATAESYDSSTGYSASPESSRSSRSPVSTKAASSGQSTPLHMVNGDRQTNQPATNRMGGEPARGGHLQGPRLNGIQRQLQEPPQRAQTELDIAHETAQRTEQSVREQNWEIRHGFEDQYDSTEYMQLLQSVRIVYLRKHRGRPVT